MFPGRTVWIEVALALDYVKHLLEQHGVFLVDAALLARMQLSAAVVKVRKPLRFFIVNRRPQVEELAGERLLLLRLDEQLTVIAVLLPAKQPGLLLHLNKEL